ncbi:SARP family transcriptional regulator [Lentzea guizhouensis]|uniref:SARP family transcriptional regulator n=1 Tax=Lentzea guizhouensis TaxID=1586287 RepID=A0A1B2HN64_9PSEU|nr:tetratricopeptide repeat protein [Lentzea guizhouensis]ANZ39135.1 SARP family transcriptional regulator [Lentzea guizhouensis]
MLGPLEAWHGDASVPLGDLQQRYVLVVLLLNANKPMTPERITEIVWPDQPERKNLVRGYIKGLRKAFELARAGDVVIETTPTGYVLRIDEGKIDTVRFDRLREQAARAVHENEQRRAVDLLREAVALWRGGFIEDIDIDRVGGVDVVFSDEGYHDALGDLAELELLVGDHRSARDRMRRAVRTRPDHQKYAELLMRALIAGGDQVGAIKVFEAAGEALAQAGFEPGPLLRNLAERARRGEPVSSLPSRPGRFTGRAAELAAVAKAAAGTGERRAVWVSGAPGVGKTGLAVEAAHRLKRRFPDGQLLVRLNGFTPNVAPTSISDALTQLLTELGVPPEQIPDTVSRKTTLYQTQLYGTKTLVVLDNAVSPDQVRPLLPEAEGCFAVVTSRHMGEPDISAHVRLAPLPPDDAFSLFTALTDPFRVHGRSADVAGLVKRCGYLPMPINIAAALFRRHDRWSLDHLLGLIDESGAWQEDGTAAIRASFRQLDAAQQETFRLFGQLPGPDVDLRGAAALLGRDIAVTRALLDELHEVCLLEEVAPDRYQMLDALKEFASADPPEAGREALLRLLDFYRVTLAAAVGTAYPFDSAGQPSVDRTSPRALSFEDQESALKWVSTERDNLVAAVHYASRNGLAGHAWRVAVLVWRRFASANRFRDWIDATELARQAVDSDRYGQAHVLLRLATTHDRLGHHADALELATTALPLWTGLGEVWGEAATLGAMAICTMQLGDHEKAMAQFETALEKYEQCGDMRGQAHVLSQLGYLHEQHHEYDTALRQQEAAVRINRTIGNQRGLAHALNNLGAIRQHLGELDDAIPEHLEAHEIATELGDSALAAYALTNIADAHRLAGRLTEAVRHHGLAEVVATGLDDADLRARLFRDRGLVARDGRDHAKALQLFQCSLDVAATTGNSTHRSHAEAGIARALHALGRHREAVPHWNLAEEVYAALDQPEAAQVRAERAELTCACGQR